MDWVIIPKKRISRRPTACGNASHMTHSTAPPTEEGSSRLAHAQKSQFHYQITSAKLKNEQSNPNPCRVPVIARSASDKAISTVHFHYQITGAKLKNEQSNPNPCRVPVIARSASDKAISTAHPENIFSKRNPDSFRKWHNNKMDNILYRKYSPANYLICNRRIRCSGDPQSAREPDIEWPILKANSSRCIQIRYQTTSAKLKNENSNPNEKKHKKIENTKQTHFAFGITL